MLTVCLTENAHVVEVEVPLICLARRLGKEAPADGGTQRDEGESQLAAKTPDIAQAK